MSDEDVNIEEELEDSKEEKPQEKKQQFQAMGKIANAAVTLEHTGFAISCSDGFKLYEMHPVTFRQHENYVPDVGPIRIAKQLGRTQIVCYTCAKGGKYPENVVMVFDMEDNRDVAELTTPSVCGPITNIHISENRLVAFTEARMYVHQFPGKCELIRGEEIRPNPHGLSAMSYDPTTSLCYLAYPGYKTGSVQIMNLNTLTTLESKAPVVIEAHLTEITQVALNCQGTLVATGSTKGTVIRVFDARTKGMLYELRRGSVQAHLQCLAFSPCSSFLAVASDKGTLHVFGIRDSESQKKPNVLERNLGTSSIARIQLSRQVLALGFSKQNATNPQALVAICSDGTYWRYPLCKDSKGTVRHNVGTFENLILLAEEALFFRTPV